MMLKAFLALCLYLKSERKQHTYEAQLLFD